MQSIVKVTRLQDTQCNLCKKIKNLKSKGGKSTIFVTLVKDPEMTNVKARYALHYMPKAMEKNLQVFEKFVALEDFSMKGCTLIS